MNRGKDPPIADNQVLCFGRLPESSHIRSATAGEQVRHPLPRMQEFLLRKRRSLCFAVHMLLQQSLPC